MLRSLFFTSSSRRTSNLFSYPLTTSACVRRKTTSLSCEICHINTFPDLLGGSTNGIRAPKTRRRRGASEPGTVAAFSSFAPARTSEAGLSPAQDAAPLDPTLAAELARRRRKADWKRRQRGSNFVDELTVTVKGGKGGDGCVAFHREKFVPRGPPSGGNGGLGGSVYIVADPNVTSLSGISRKVSAPAGGSGRGTWMHGRKGEDLILRVPVGTVVKEVERDGGRLQIDEWSAGEVDEEEMDEQALLRGDEEAARRRRDKLWVHYPRFEEENEESEAFKAAEMALLRERRHAAKRAALHQATPVVDMDLSVPTPIDSPILLATGGQGGLGNPFFVAANARTPKYATRGQPGTLLRLKLELKSLADVGLVGFPNAGKTTLLRSVSNVRAEVAGYAFTTLNPQVGLVEVGEDGSLGATGKEPILETREEEQILKEQENAGIFSSSSLRRQRSDQPDNSFFRLTISDNPGLLPQASQNIGLGHAFLRHIERCRVLVYVLDFSEPEPWEALRTLRNELEEYQVGLSAKARIVVANKADLLGPPTSTNLAEGREGTVKEERRRKRAEAREKLARLEAYVQEMYEADVELAMRNGDEPPISPLEVIPASAKYRQNVVKVVSRLRDFVRADKEAEAEAKAEAEAGEG